MMPPARFPITVALFFVGDFARLTSAFGGTILDDSTTIRAVSSTFPAINNYTGNITADVFFVKGGSTACDLVAHNLNLLIGSESANYVTCTAVSPMPYPYKPNEKAVLGVYGDNCSIVANNISILLTGRPMKRNQQGIVACFDYTNEKRNANEWGPTAPSTFNKRAKDGSAAVTLLIPAGVGGEAPVVATEQRVTGPRAFKRIVETTVHPSTVIAADSEDDDDDVVATPGSGWVYHHHHQEHHNQNNDTDDDDYSDDSDDFFTAPEWPYTDQLNAQLRPVRCSSNMCVADQYPTKVRQVVTNATCNESCGPRYACQNSQCVEVPFRSFNKSQQLTKSKCESSCQMFACHETQCKPIHYGAPSGRNWKDCNAGCQSYACIDSQCQPIGYKRGNQYTKSDCETFCSTTISTFESYVKQSWLVAKKTVSSYLH